MLHIVLFLIAITAESQATVPDDEIAVTAAVLESYISLHHRGVGIAFPETRRPVLLHRLTISPSRSQLRVRVSSPANRDAARRYAAANLAPLAERLRQRSTHPRVLRISHPAYVLSKARRSACGPEYDAARFTDAVAVSRPAFDGRGSALLYLESSGGARAYHAIRKGTRWAIDWSVELWACG